LLDFAQKIMEKLPSQTKLHHIRLDETPNSYAEWYAEDN
jgi:6-pyruvoyltetrahydropterin/6-carboxytetrahydropterin synthase